MQPYRGGVIQLRMPSTHQRPLALALAAATGLATSVPLLAGCFAAGHSRTAAEPPAPFDTRDVSLPGNDGRGLQGWFAEGRPGGGAVVLLHGMGADRTVMRERIRFLRARGFAVLAPDFRGHGRRGGGPVTFGRRESDDARAALTWLRAAAPGERVGVVGISMGGAAALLGDSALPVDAMVLESVYPTITDAVRDRLRSWLGPAGGIGARLAPMVTRAVGARAGVGVAELRPIDHIPAVRAPLLLASGTRDPYTPISEARALFARATAPRELWEVEGATHEDLYAFDPPAYEQRVGGFLISHLQRARRVAQDDLWDVTPSSRPTTGSRRSSSAPITVPAADTRNTAANFAAGRASHCTATYAAPTTAVWCTRYQP